MRRPILPLILLLAALGIAGTLVRSWTLGYPLFPRITARIWMARLAVEWEGLPAGLSLVLPRESDRQSLVDERILSGPLETTITVGEDGQRRLRWRGRGATRAAYEAEVAIRREPIPGLDLFPDEIRRWLSLEGFPAPAANAARRLAVFLPLGEAGRRCPDLLFAPPERAPQDLAADLAHLRHAAASPREALLLCWRAAGLPARAVQLFPLVSGLHRQPQNLAEVFLDGGWQAADPAGGRFPVSTRDFLVWGTEAVPLVEADPGAGAFWQVELRPRPLSLWEEFFRQTADRSSWLARWSLYALPADAREVFRVLLLVPLGALIVAFLRNVVGFPTFGTFMPILIAIALRQTELAVGLAIFTAVLGAGYLVRLGLDRYKLLLVPRLSVILTFVIGCLAATSLLAYRTGVSSAVGVGLLPMVILTMTIERFFVVAEESGGGTALRMGASTGAVAVITYALLSWEYLQLLFFTYPELLLLVLAAQMALGRYVGFRLTELWRFRRIVEGA